MTMVVALSILSCGNPNKKEIADVEALYTVIDNTEKLLLAVDTAAVFSAKRQMDKDITALNEYVDTLNKEEAFRLDDIFGAKKRLNSLTKNYSRFINQIKFSKNQLNNLKQDLQNDLMTKEAFKNHYAMEEDQLMMLDKQINKAIDNIDVAIEKLNSDRPELLEMIERRKLESASDE